MASVKKKKLFVTSAKPFNLFVIRITISKNTPNPSTDPVVYIIAFQVQVQITLSLSVHAISCQMS